MRMRLILDAFWMATCWAARLLTAPTAFLVYLMTLLMLWTGSRRNEESRHIGRGRPDTAIPP
jgi:hypothetical protein